MCVTEKDIYDRMLTNWEVLRMDTHTHTRSNIHTVGMLNRINQPHHFLPL